MSLSSCVRRIANLTKNLMHWLYIVYIELFLPNKLITENIDFVIQANHMRLHLTDVR